MRGGTDALRRRPATWRPPKLDEDQVERVRSALEQGAQAYDFEADLWTPERVGAVVMRVTGVTLSRASVWRLLTGRLGWSLQRPERPELFAAEVRRTYAPRGHTPLLRHRLNWKRASMAAALGYHAADPDRGSRLCFHLNPAAMTPPDSSRSWSR
ncbi:winged helix-turn-helix domain-containing protein [Streptomyces sp. NPDC056525]|uniref:winged helix-turn-helix domain-containing protein n=1 Tax=unclassified Streptomyces TaxID=2593676 RepID=UPI0036A341E5